MSRECNGKPISFRGHGSGEVTASFNGGRLSSDGGELLPQEADNAFGITGRLAGFFSDHRDPERSGPWRSLWDTRILTITTNCATVTATIRASLLSTRTCRATMSCELNLAESVPMTDE